MKNCKLVFTFLFLFICCVNINAQTISFQKNYGNYANENGYDIIQLYNGNYAITGWKDENWWDAFLLVIDQSGNTLIEKRYGTFNDDKTYSLVQTNDSGFVLLGETNDEYPSGGASTETDIYVIKTDSIGHLVWQKRIGNDFSGTGDQGSELAGKIIITHDNNILFSGQTANPFQANNYYPALLCKMNLAGDTIWTKEYGFGFGRCLIETQGNDFILAGEGVLWSNHSTSFIMKTDSLGNTIWSKIYIPANAFSSFFSVSFQSIVAEGTAYTVAGIIAEIGSSHLFMMSVDTSGSILWTKQYDNTGSGTVALKKTNDGGYILTGTTSSFGAGTPTYTNILLIKTDSLGNIQWSRAYGAGLFEESFSVNCTLDSSYIITGFTGSFGQPNIYVVKTDSLGNSGCNDYPATPVVSNVTMLDSSITTTSRSGMWYVDFPIFEDSIPNYAEDSICFVIQTGIKELPNANEQIAVKTFPNPTNSTLTIEINSLRETAAEVLIENVLGQTVFSKPLMLHAGKNNAVIDISNFSRGIYFLQVKTKERSYVQKVVKE